MNLLRENLYSEKRNCNYNMHDSAEEEPMKSSNNIQNSISGLGEAIVKEEPFYFNEQQDSASTPIEKPLPCTSIKRDLEDHPKGKFTSDNFETSEIRKPYPKRKCVKRMFNYIDPMIHTNIVGSNISFSRRKNRRHKSRNKKAKKSSSNKSLSFTKTAIVKLKHLDVEEGKSYTILCKGNENKNKSFVEKVLEVHNPTFSGVDEVYRKLNGNGKKIKVKIVRDSDVKIHAREELSRCYFNGNGKQIKVKFVDDSDVQIHVIEKPLICSFCDKKFFKSNRFIDHLGIHSRVETFDCIYCKNAFLWENQLKEHIKSHTTTKKFRKVHKNKEYLKLQENMNENNKHLNVKENTKENLEIYDDDKENYVVQGNTNEYLENHNFEHKNVEDNNERLEDHSNINENLENYNDINEYSEVQNDTNEHTEIYGDININLKVYDNINEYSGGQNDINEHSKVDDDINENLEVHKVKNKHLEFHDDTNEYLNVHDDVNEHSELEDDLNLHLELQDAVSEHDNDIIIENSQINLNRDNPLEVSPNIDNAKHICSFCKEKFRFKRNLLIHLKSHSDTKTKVGISNEISVINACEQTTSTNCNISEQVLIKVYECAFCTCNFENKINLRNHLLIHQLNIDQYRCPHCDESFQTNTNLIDHLEMHAAEKKRKCNLCEMSFTRRDKLRKHVKTHEIEEATNYACKKVSICKQCGKVFKDKTNFNKHMENHTEDARMFTENRRMLDSQNKRLFNKRKAMTDSQMNISPNHTYNMANYSKSGKCQVKVRRITNRKKIAEILVVCTYCGSEFGSDDDLKTHALTHNGNMPYECLHCGCKCSRKDELLNHIRMHGLIAYYRAKKFLCQ